MTNYGFDAHGLAAGTGCTGSGLLATLNFHAVANGSSAVTVSGVVMSDQTGSAYPASDTTFPGFTQWVGAAPNLVITYFTLAPAAGTGGRNFYAIVTIHNTGGNTSLGTDTLAITSDGNSTPTSVGQTVPPIGAGGYQIYSFPMVLTGATSLVTAAIPSFNTSASGTYSLASANGKVIVDASFGASIQITPPANVNFSHLALGNNSQTGTLNVKCNSQGYEVDAISDQAFFGTQWNGAYLASPKKLSNALQVSSAAAGGSHTVSNGTPAALITGTPPMNTPAAGTNFAITFAQALSFADPVLPAGQTYHQVLTFDAYVTL